MSIAKLLASNEELSQSKESMEMKACEQEKQEARWNGEKADLSAKVQVLEQELQVGNCFCRLLNT